MDSVLKSHPKTLFVVEKAVSPFCSFEVDTISLQLVWVSSLKTLSMM